MIERMTARRTLLAGLLAAGLLAACGDDGGSTPEGSEGIEVNAAWARVSPAGVTIGAAYMTITAGDADALVGVSVAPDVAARAEIHEVVGAGPHPGDSSHTTGDPGGEMSMRPVSRIPLPAGTSVALEPGGYHVMLLDLAAPLAAGRRFDLTLRFESDAEQVVTVEVREGAP